MRHLGFINEIRQYMSLDFLNNTKLQMEMTLKPITN